MTCQIPTKVGFGPPLETSVDDGSFCKLMQHLSRCALFSVEELKHLHHAGRARQSQSHVCHHHLVRDPECTHPTARLYPSSGCATTGGDVLISSGFRAFVIPCNVSAQMALGESLSGKLIPLGSSGFQ